MSDHATQNQHTRAALSIDERHGATSSVRDRTPFLSVSPVVAYVIAWWSVVALEVTR